MALECQEDHPAFVDYGVQANARMLLYANSSRRSSHSHVRTSRLRSPSKYYGYTRVVGDNTCQTASRGLARSLKPVFTRGEVLATVFSLMGLAVGLRCGGNV